MLCGILFRAGAGGEMVGTLRVESNTCSPSLSGVWLGSLLPHSEKRHQGACMTKILRAEGEEGPQGQVPGMEGESSSCLLHGKGNRAFRVWLAQKLGGVCLPLVFSTVDTVRVHRPGLPTP